LPFSTSWAAGDQELAKKTRFAAYVNFADSKISPVPAVKQLVGRVGAFGFDTSSPSLLPLQDKSYREHLKDPREILEFPEALEAAVEGGFDGFVTVRFLVRPTPKQVAAAKQAEVDYKPLSEAVLKMSQLAEKLKAKAPPSGFNVK
jgi:hypothetical protein